MYKYPYSPSSSFPKDSGITSCEPPHPELIGQSDAIREVYSFVARVSDSSSTVLLQGESGTGKELVAKAIHHRSQRSSGPFVAINCAALTESLLESELFGYERGAFTGAFGRSKGLIECADGGTFFFDELSELTPTIQAKLLRVVQERCITRIGGRSVVPIDARFIAATNKNLEEEVAKGNFREDLFYRLNVVSTTVPPLRERGEDILLLAKHFLRISTQTNRRVVAGFSPEAEHLLMQHPWPGNVRELTNVVQRAVLLGNNPVITPEDLPATLVLPIESGRTDGIHQYRESLVNWRRSTLQSAIERSGGNLTLAAKLLGVHRNYLYRLMKTLDMRSSASLRRNRIA